MKKIRVIYMIVIAFVIGAVTIGTFVFDNRSDNENSTAELETNMSFGLASQLESRISGNFGFRKQLVSLDTFLQEKIMHTSNVSDVILGRNGNLFFAQTTDDYQGIVTMSKRQQYNTVRTLELMQKAVEKDGGQFRFVIAPNKNSLYDDMPYNYKKYSDKGNADILIPQLSNVNMVNLFPVFYEEPEQMYFKKDTHWNNKGALMAYDAIMESLGKKFIGFDEYSFVKQQDFVGDLEKMLKPEDAEKDIDYRLDYDFHYHYLTRTRSVEQSYIESENADGTGSLYMFRDSFGNALLPYFAETYSKAVFDKSSNYNLLLKEKYNADAVILEIAERNLPLISQSNPVFYASEYQADQKQPVNADAEEVRGDGYTEIIGTLDETIVQKLTGIDEAQILLRLNNTFYEMTPQTVNGNDYGFCAYFPENTDLTDYEIYID